MITKPWLALVLVAALLAAAGGGYVKGRADVTAAWTAARFKADAQTAQALARSLAAVRAQERAWSETQRKLEAQAHDRERIIAGLRIANGRLLAAAGGLFDRNGKPVGGAAVSCASGPSVHAADAAAGCQLSGAVSEALLDLALDADRAAAYAQTCRAWIESATVSGTGPSDEGKPLMPAADAADRSIRPPAMP